jgi:hypothetical protein
MVHARKGPVGSVAPSLLARAAILILTLRRFLLDSQIIPIDDFKTKSFWNAIVDFSFPLNSRISSVMARRLAAGRGHIR